MNRAVAAVVAALTGVVAAITIGTGIPAAARAASAPDCAEPANAAMPEVSWPLLRLAPQQAWSHGRGRGISIATISSGVDAAAPALAGRVAVGADIVTGQGFANTDCLGDGTAMAGVAVAQSRPGSGLVGLAPDATVIPVRIDRDGPQRSAQLAVALQVAVSAGASVVMVDGAVDLTEPEVAQAVRATIARDVVVVVAADRLAGSERQPGLLRVGAVDAANRMVGQHPLHAVDVVAPGATVVTVSANGAGEVVRAGSNLAVAFVAGLVAVVRSSAAGLSATATTEQIERTADGLGDQLPDPVTGWGLINPGQAAQAYQQAIEGDPGTELDGAHSSGDGTGAPVLIGVPALVLLAGIGGLVLAGTVFAVARMHRASARRRWPAVPPVDAAADPSDDAFRT